MRSLKQKTTALVLSVMMLLCIMELCAPALAFAADPTVVTVIVELTEDSALRQEALRGTDVSQRAATARRLRSTQTRLKSQIRANVRAADTNGFTYANVINGFSMRVSSREIDAIRAMDGVKNVYISRAHPHTPEEQLQADEVAAVSGVESISALTEIAEMHAQGYCGEGMLIAIVDSEFDMSHPFITAPLADPSVAKYASASAVQAVMNSGDLNANVRANRAWQCTKVPFAWNYDSESTDTFSSDPDVIHGTHVAGIAAGKNGALEDGETFNGVAPEAQLLCLASPEFFDDQCIAAIDDAVALGADVINMSWGSDFEETTLFDTVFENAAAGGVLLVAAAGNSSRVWSDPAMTDYGSMGTPGLNGHEFNVGSACSSLYFEDVLILTVNGVSFESEDFRMRSFGDLGDVPFVYCGDANGKLPDVKDKVAVFPIFADLDLLEKAIEKGAAGLLFLDDEESYNNYPDEDDEESFYYYPDEPYENEYDWFEAAYDLVELLPCALVDAKYGSLFSGSGMMYAEYGHAEGDVPAVMAEYSSWGVGSDLTLNPDITAPGDHIWSSVPEEFNGNYYEYFDGTSMAAPHITGAAVLIKQYLLKNEAGFAALSPQEQTEEIRERMQSAAQVLLQPAGVGGSTEDSLPYSPRLQGAGLLQTLKAACTPVVLRQKNGEAKISLGEISTSFTVSFTARNLSNLAATYDQITLTLFTTDPSDAESFNASVNVPIRHSAKGLPKKVTVDAHGETEISFTVALKGEDVRTLREDYVNGFFVDGFVFLSQSQGTLPELSVPLTGFCGDWSAAPVLDNGWWDEDSPVGLTRLLRSTGAISAYAEDYDRFTGFFDVVEAALGTNPYVDMFGYSDDDRDDDDWYWNVDYDLDDDNDEVLDDDYDDVYDGDWDDDSDGLVDVIDVWDDSGELVGFDDTLTYNAKEFAGISPNGDGDNDSLVVDLFPLRAAKSVKLTVLCDNGKPIAQTDGLSWYNDDREINTPYGDSVSLQRLMPNVLQLMQDFNGVPEDSEDFPEEGWQVSLPEGDYQLQIKAKYRDGSKHTETLLLPFYVDVTAPTITDAGFVTESGTTYLEVTANDDRHLAAICITDSDGWLQEIYPVAGSTSATCRFDTSELVFTEDFRVYAEDYAGNCSEFQITNGADFLSGYFDVWNQSLGDKLVFSLQQAHGETLSEIYVNDKLVNEAYQQQNDGYILLTPAAMKGVTGECTVRFCYDDGAVFTKSITVIDKPALNGDPDSDGRITSADARIALRTSVKLERVILYSAAYRICDVNGNGVVAADDARMILRAAVGLEKLG